MKKNEGRKSRASVPLRERQLQMLPKLKVTFAPIGCVNFQLCRQEAPATNVAKMEQIFAPFGCATFWRI
jgi:hypothetical protein